MEPVIFKPIPQEDIEVMTFEDLHNLAKQKRLFQDGRDNKKGWGSILVGALILALSHAEGFGGILGLALILTGIYFIIAAGINCLESRKAKVNQKILKGTIHNRRHSAIGNCPVCQSELILYDSVTDHNFQCSACTANLHAQNYEVVAA